MDFNIKVKDFTITFVIEQRGLDDETIERLASKLNRSSDKLETAVQKQAETEPK